MRACLQSCPSLLARAAGSKCWTHDSARVDSICGDVTARNTEPQALRISGAAIALDHLPVELDAEAGPARDFHGAVLDRRAIRPHDLPHRVALGVGKTFDVRAVRHAGEELRGDL